MTTGNITVFRSGFDMVNSIIIDGNGTLYTTKTNQGSLWAFYSMAHKHGVKIWEAL